MDLRTRLETFRQEEKRLAWEGTFADYFDLVVKQPQVARLSHARIYDMITSAGADDGPQGRKVHRFFQDEIYGLEDTLDQLVEYFHSAAKRLEVRKRILLFMGPVGGGKSTIVAMLKRGLERYSRADDGAVYAIKGCPMHEEPLHLVPESLRTDVEREYGIYVEGDLCPVCRQTLRDDYG